MYGLVFERFCFSKIDFFFSTVILYTPVSPNLGVLRPYPIAMVHNTGADFSV